jgi:hypothetical protein
MHLCGIDPGLSDAVAVLAPDGRLEALCDTPHSSCALVAGTCQEYDVPSLVALLAP